MQVAPHDRGKNLADSVIAWWRDAGVDFLCEETPVNWLAEPTQPTQMAALALPQRQTAMPAKAVVSKRGEWPSTLGGLADAIKSDATLPGNGYGPLRAAPVSVENPDIMIFTDFPEEEDLAFGQLGQGTVGRLMQAMLRACGIAPDKVYLGALAYSRPASAALPPLDQALLRDFARHQINIVRPKELLLFGSAVTETLLGQELMEARTNLPEFNQDGGNLATVATFHPRTLLARPVLKAQAWRDLQRIVRKDQA